MAGYFVVYGHKSVVRIDENSKKSIVTARKRAFDLYAKYGAEVAPVLIYRGHPWDGGVLCGRVRLEIGRVVYIEIKNGIEGNEREFDYKTGKLLRY